MRSSVLLAIPALLLAGCGSSDTPSGPPPTNLGDTGPTITGTGGPGTLASPVSAADKQAPATVGQGVAMSAIQQQLMSLVSLSQVGEPMTGLQAITQGQNVAQFFAPGCAVVMWPDAGPINGNGPLAGEVGGWLGHAQIAKFELKKQYTKVSPDRTQARSILLVKGVITYPDRLVTYEGWYSADWIPVQGSWLIQAVKPITVAQDTKAGPTAPELPPEMYFNPYWGPGWGYY